MSGDFVPFSPLVPPDESILSDPWTSPTGYIPFPFTDWGSPGVRVMS